MHINVPKHGQNFCSSCMNVSETKKKKKTKTKEKSKGIGKSVLPIYTANSQAIIKSTICNKYYKIQFIWNIANK